MGGARGSEHVEARKATGCSVGATTSGARNVLPVELKLGGAVRDASCREPPWLHLDTNNNERISTAKNSGGKGGKECQK
jgi:hypothetical protein